MFDINHYFSGKVSSIGFKSETLPATVGVMAPGEFEFTTAQKETMTVVSGALRVKLPDTEAWTTFHSGDSFIVEAGKSFNVQVSVDTAYLCTYE